MRIKDERAWLECHAQRPPLFPGRRDREGDGFAERLQKFAQSARSAENGAQAHELLDRYRAKAK